MSQPQPIPAACGEILMLDTGPTKRSEESGDRPCIVVSDDGFNVGSPFRWIMPITNQLKGYVFEVVLPEGCGATGAVLTNQIRTLDLFGPSSNRPFKKVGHLPYGSDEFQEIIVNATAILA